ncbi:hypothetical protein ACFFIY_02935 [Bhargavaea ullalensis]|uniref:Uncharacterized protein n=1 Tax=Bhargavaea ullalensis TaxID=1265685 RepID=A0ABV2GCX5_9BACL
MDAVLEHEREVTDVYRLDILRADWTENWDFIVELEADSPEQLGSDHALLFAKTVAGRRRCKIYRSVGPILPGTGKMKYQRAFRFSRWE